MKYFIVYNNTNNRVTSVETRRVEFVHKPTEISVAEYEGEIPEHEWLTVANIQEKTDTWTEERARIDEKTHEEIIEQVDMSRTYLTCELVANFKTYTEEELTQQKAAKYNSRVAQLVRQKYNADAVEALLANYAENPDKYKKEFEEFAEYRAKCKTTARLEIYGGY